MTKTQTPCQCQNFADAATGQTTGCTAVTASTFAPGHDAKLKGLLIAAGRKDHEIRIAGETGTVTATTAAHRFPKLVAKVTESIAKGSATTTPAEATPAPKKSQGTTFTASYGDVTETRTSKTRTYTHAAVYMVHGGEIVIGSWHSSEALAAKGTNGMKPVAVVAVTTR